MTDTVTIRDHLEARLAALDARMSLHLDLSQLAVDKASARMEDRLAAMNEFRDALKDQAARFVTRAELDPMIKLLSADIRILRESRAHLEGVAKTGAVYLGYALSLAALIVAVASVLIN